MVWVFAFWDEIDKNAGMHNNADDGAPFEIADDDVERVVVKAPAGRSKVFRSYDPDQSFLMPPSLDELPQDPTARFIEAP